MKLSRLFVLGILAVLVGCSSTTMYVDSTTKTNAGRPFQMLIRTVDYKKYLLESYQEVAAKVFDDAENTVFKKETIYPGKQFWNFSQAIQCTNPDQVLGFFSLRINSCEKIF